MALPRIVESLESVDESLREHYAENDEGQFVLDVEGDGGGQAVEALRRERRDRKRAEKRVKELEGLESELDELREFREEYEGRVLKEADVEQLKAGIEKKYTRELDKMKAQLEEAQARNSELTQKDQKRFLRDEVQKALDEHEALADRLRPHVLDRVHLETSDDGESEIIARGLDDEETDVLTLVGQMKTAKDSDGRLRFGWGFAANGGAGGGASGSGGRAAGNGAIRTKADLTTAAAKSQFIDEHGLEAFRSLPRE